MENTTSHIHDYKYSESYVRNKCSCGKYEHENLLSDLQFLTSEQGAYIKKLETEIVSWEKEVEILKSKLWHVLQKVPVTENVYITEEILESFGFEKSERDGLGEWEGEMEPIWFIGHYGYHLHRYNNNVEQGDLQWALLPTLNDRLVITHIRYVHELISLYRLIVGKELNTNS